MLPAPAAIIAVAGVASLLWAALALAGMSPIGGSAVSRAGASGSSERVRIVETSPPVAGGPRGASDAAREENPVAVPLPAAIYSGLIGLGAVAWAKRRMRAT